MQAEFGDYQNGRIAVATVGDLLSVSVRWPFDRATDEWITLRSDFRSTDLHVDHANRTLQARNTDTLSEVMLSAGPQGSYTLQVKGRNSLSPVQADLTISEELGRPLFEHLASEA